MARGHFPAVGALLGLGVVLAGSSAEAGEGAHRPDTGLFCKLGPEQMRRRIGAIRAGLLEHVAAVDELPGGYRFWLPRSDANLRTLADFVYAESDCCSFFDFEIGLGAGATRASLAITGSPEAKKMVAAMLEAASFDLAAALSNPTGRPQQSTDRHR